MLRSHIAFLTRRESRALQILPFVQPSLPRTLPTGVRIPSLTGRSSIHNNAVFCAGQANDIRCGYSGALRSPQSVCYCRHGICAVISLVRNVLPAKSSISWCRTLSRGNNESLKARIRQEPLKNCTNGISRGRIPPFAIPGLFMIVLLQVNSAYRPLSARSSKQIFCNVEITRTQDEIQLSETYVASFRSLRTCASTMRLGGFTTQSRALRS